MNLNEVNRGITKHKTRKRIGRGPGSGQGKTAGRGHKGQRSRSGASFSMIFEGGQMPLVRRIPKRGFNNKFADTVVVVNLADIEERFEAGAQVTMETLRERNLAKGRYDRLKILGNGELTKKLTITAHQFSKSALEKIQNVGGEAVVLPGKKPVVRNKMKPKFIKQGS
jgi:large subunit ribosomal protein L15